MDAVSLIVGALLLGAGFFAGASFCPGEKDEYTSTYKKEYARNNGLYEPRKR